MWDKLVEEAKHQERVGKEYARFWRENSGGSTPSYGDPALATDAVSRGTRSLSRDHGHHLEAKVASPSSVIGVESATAVEARRELVQHGARSVAFARDGTTTRQSAGRLPRSKEQEVGLNRSMGKGLKPSPGKAKAKYNAHSMVLKMVLSGEEGKLLRYG